MESIYATGDATLDGDYPRCNSIASTRTVKNCILLVSEEGLPLKIEKLLGTLKIGPFFYYTIIC